MDQPGGQRPTLSGTVQRPGGDGAPPSGQMPQITLTPGTLQSGQMPQISMTPGTLSGSMFAITPAGLLTNVATGAGQGQTPRRTRTAQAPDSSAEAEAALVGFGSDHLGIIVSLNYAGSASASASAVLALLPAEIQAKVATSISISGAIYWGSFPSGAAAVMVGDCATNPDTCAVSMDSLSAQLTSAAAGIYAIASSGTATASSADALTQILATYPGLNGLSFTESTEIDTGFAFTATTTETGIDAEMRQPIAVVKVVYAGVISAGGQNVTYALVGMGQGYVSAITG